jgi:transposase
LPSSKLGKAFTYAGNQKAGLMNYLLDGNCSISNNLAENSIRPFTIGRKNWLFSGSPKGAEASAGIYTLIETAKANGLSPMKYIQFILGDIPGTSFLEYPEYLEEYMPWDPVIQKLCR